MTTPLEIQDLVADVVHQYPSAQIELDPLPSGVCFLWVALASRTFVLEHHPSQGTGVSENLPDTLLFGGHDRAFDLLAGAVLQFKTLLASAAKPALALAHA